MAGKLSNSFFICVLNSYLNRNTELMDFFMLTC